MSVMQKYNITTVFSSVLEYRTMNKVQSPSSSEN
jgi:hypothetical protein